MPIEIEFYQPEHLQDLSYDLGEQLKNTASAEIALARISGGSLPKAKPFTIIKDRRPVGFFLLDFGTDKTEISENENSVLLRSLSVNPGLQGKGIGKNSLSALPEFVRKHFPGVDEIILAVNEKNPRAKNLYEDLGYALLPKMRQGKSGLQLLMSKKI